MTPSLIALFLLISIQMLDETQGQQLREKNEISLTMTMTPRVSTTAAATVENPFPFLNTTTTDAAAKRHMENHDDDYEEEEDGSDDAEEEGSSDHGQEEEEGGQTTITSSITCVPVSQCELCNREKRQSEGSCKETGKEIKMKCLVSSQGSMDDVFKYHYQSCNRTSMDEEYLMIRFQALCLFIAFFSLRSVRREKVVSASLFDIRSKRRIRQEMVPLNSNNNNNSSMDNNGMTDTERSDVIQNQV